MLAVKHKDACFTRKCELFFSRLVSTLKNLKMPRKPVGKSKAPAPTRKAKSPVGRKCSICHHKEVDRINSLIHDGVSFRAISSQVQNDEKMRASLQRHTENCLKVELAALVQKKKEEQAINVYTEFEENLAFARSLRLAAWEYLSNPADPLKISLIPFAHEIDISYFDNTDLTEGKFPKPKKKSAKLDMLIAQIELLRNIDVDKISIKHVDLRSYAVECIRAVDMCIDKFARLGGAYKKDQPNETNPEEVARKVALRLVKEFGWGVDDALAHVGHLYRLQRPLALNAGS